MGRTRTKTRKAKEIITKNTSEEVQPPSLRALLEKAQSLIGQSDYDLGQLFVNRILERDPRNVEAKELLGVTQLETDDVDSARRVRLVSTFDLFSIPKLAISRPSKPLYHLTLMLRLLLRHLPTSTLRS